MEKQILKERVAYLQPIDVRMSETKSEARHIICTVQAQTEHRDKVKNTPS